MSTERLPSTSPTPTGYVLLDEIGRGGMGVVHRARDVRLDREVAVKLLHSEVVSHGSASARFHAEALITGRLQHPGIPAVHELGTLADGRPFLAMKLVQGHTLKELLRERSASANGHADAQDGERGRFLAIFEHVCHAVGYAHAQGVIHRDLKPGNIMVGAFGEVQVMDWGLAKVLSAEPSREGEHASDPDATAAFVPFDTPLVNGSATRTGEVMGTPAFMPPEQAGGEIRKLDARSDVFGLGALLCQILTGKPPYSGKDAIELCLQAVRGETTAALQALDRCGAEPALIALCQDCLSFRQEDRPANGQAVADAVAAIRHQAETRARQAERERAEALVREAEQRKRRRLVQWSAVAVALVLLGGTTVSLWQLFRALAAESATAEQLVKTQQAEAETSAQLTKTRAAEADARRKLSFAQRSNAIMASVFEGLDPKGKYTTVSDLRDALKANLTKAVQQLNDGSIGDPLTVAAMQHRLGLSLLSLGDAHQAIVLFKTARESHQAILGADHPNTLTIMSNLAMGYHTVRKLDLALPLLKETLKLRKVRLGADHPDTLTSMNNLARGYQAAGELDRALPLYEETLKLRKAKLGADHPDTLTSMNNLAVSYQAAGKLDRALPLLEETLKLRKARAGADHSATLTSMSNLAAGYHAAGKLDRALPLYEEILKLHKARLGVNHSDTLLTMNNLAEGYQDAGKLDLALPLLEETLKLRKARLGADHPDTLMSMNNLARGYKAAGKLDLALPLFVETLKLRKARLGADHPNTLTSMWNLSLTHRDAGRFAEALAPMQELVRRRSPRHHRYAPEQRALKTLHVLLARERRLPDVLKGQQATAVEQLQLAELCHRFLKRYRDAVKLYRAAFTQEPARAANVQTAIRTSAARAAVLAAAGRGQAADSLDHAERATLRRQARDWLHADLTSWRELLRRQPAAAPHLVAAWQQVQTTADLASVRDREALAKLPAAESKAWQQLWDDVAALHKQARGSYTEKVLRDTLTSGGTEQTHEIRLSAGNVYVFDMQSKQFDTFLRLHDAAGNKLAENDDVNVQANNRNSRLRYTPKQDGTVRLVATSYQQRGRGAYEIVIRAFTAPQTPTNGKTAPAGKDSRDIPER